MISQATREEVRPAADRRRLGWRRGCQIAGVALHGTDRLIGSALLGRWGFVRCHATASRGIGACEASRGRPSQAMKDEQALLSSRRRNQFNAYTSIGAQGQWLQSVRLRTSCL